MMPNYNAKPLTDDMDRNQFISYIYLTYRTECTCWLIQKFGLGREDAIDVFQNAIIVVDDKVNNHGLDLPPCKVRAYLYGVVRNKGLEYLRSLEKYVKENYLDQYVRYGKTQEEKHEEEQLMHTILYCMDSLSANARQVLSLYYNDRHSISDITKIMNYKNNDTTKNMKYKSLQKLRRLVTSHSQDGTLLSTAYAYRG